MDDKSKYNGSRVAVLAVHGVADQSVNKTAHQACAILLSEQLDVEYEFFDEQKIHIGLNSIVLDKHLDLEADSLWSFPPVQSSSISHCVYQQQKIKYVDMHDIEPSELDCEQLEHESMREQLQGYENEVADSVHETIVLKGRRASDQENSEDIKVDVYESYWADLSRLKSGYFTAFFEFYLFLFFFSRIGGITVERAVAFFRSSNDWRLLQKLHWVSEICLVIAIPLSYMALLSLSASGAPYLLQAIAPNIDLGLIFLAVFGVFVAAMGILSACFFVKQRGHRWWPVLFLLILVTATGLILAIKPLAQDLRLLVLLLWLLCSSGFLWLCYVYNQRRPGAFLFGVIFFTITGITFTFFLFVSSTNTLEYVFNQGVEATRWVINLNIISWVVFVFSTLFSSITGFYITSKLQGKEKTLAQKTVWTQTLSLILPGTLIMLISFSLLQAIYHLTTKLIPEDVIAPLQLLIDEFIFPHLSHALGILCLGVLFAFWMVSPALFFDKFKPDLAKRVKASSWIGKNLTNAYKKMRWVGELFRIMLLVALPVEWFLHMVPNDIVHHNIDFHRNIILYGGLLIVFMMFGSKGPLSFLGMGFRAGLDVGLDVANWLRYRPRETNPRAAIFRRYVAILKHIAQWRDPKTGQGYDRLVIVAHSQGTVITADILRFLTQEFKNSNLSQRSPELARFFLSGTDNIPISLLTFGSPLRQLYSERFPLQYKWAGVNADNTNQKGSFQGPDPHTLALTSWSNLYCSGDYVGRYLWCEEDDEYVWSNTWTDDQKSHIYPNAREKCLGAGGHTNYWTGELPDVALELDRLIHSQP